MQMAENFLTKEVAGQPMGVWAVVVAGGLGIAYFVNKQQSSDIEPQPEPLTEPGVGTGLVPAGAAIVPGTGNTEGPQFENNSQWGNAAKAFLISQGHNPTVADNAVRKYLVSEQLTQQENAMIQLVLASGVGVPPEDLAPAPEPGTGEVGDPELHVDAPHTTNVGFGDRITVGGRVTIGGESPGTPQPIRYTSFGKGNVTPIRKWVVMSDADGRFSSNFGGWGAYGLRAYEIAWRDSAVRRFVRVTR